MFKILSKRVWVPALIVAVIIFAGSAFVYQYYWLARGEANNRIVNILENFSITKDEWVPQNPEVLRGIAQKIMDDRLKPLESQGVPIIQRLKKYLINEITISNIEDICFRFGVDYSVETYSNDSNDSNWIVGNGEPEGDWVKNKVEFMEVIREGDNYKVIGSGTGTGTNTCLVSVAATKQDSSICDKIQDKSDKDYCYSGVAAVKKDPRICYNIQDQETKNFCCSNNKTEQQALNKIFIYSPANGEVLRVGQTYQVKWAPSDPCELVDIKLKKSPYLSLDLVWEFPNNVVDDGSYPFVVTNDLVPGEKYKFFIDGEESGEFSISK